jgi:hypothetical protein
MLQLLKKHWLLVFTAVVAGAALGALLAMPQDLGTGSAQSLFGVGLVIDLIRAGLGVALVYLLLRLRDVVMGIDFRDQLSHVFSEPVGGAIYFGAWVLGLFMFAGQVLASPAPTTYDQPIERAVQTYLPDVGTSHGWQVLKAQYWQESRLDPAAVSPVGAAGIAQFMPGTWSDMRRAMGWGAVSPHLVEPAILAGAAYMAQLRAGWSAPRPEWDRHSLALASYNAGFGHLLAAQRQCGGPNRYAAITTCLPAVTGRHSDETLTYVQRIWRYHAQMAAGLL